MQRTSHRYLQVDVFADRPGAGNPLAVITDARGLTDIEMQQVAAEFGYSETTFVLPASDPANTAEVRIFTPVTEVPFAGHPNVGTAYVLGRQPEIFGRAPGDTLRQLVETLSHTAAIAISKHREKQALRDSQAGHCTRPSCPIL